MFQLWEIPIFIIYIALAVWMVRKMDFFRQSGLSPDFLTGVLLLKIVAGTLLAALYTYYYTDRATADVYRYFDDSKIMYDALWTKPGDFFSMLFGIDNDSDYFNYNYYNHMNNWFRKYESNIYNDSHTIIRINALLRVFSFGSYHVHTVFSCMVSFTGLVALYRVFKTYVPGKEVLLAILVFLLPSTLFWSSGVLKEAYLIGALGLLFYHFHASLIHGISSVRIIVGVFCVIVLLYLKVYVLMALLPGMIGLIWVRFSNEKRIFLKFATVIVLSIVAAVFFEKVFPDYRILKILVEKQEDFIRLAEHMNSGSQVYTVILKEDPLVFSGAAPVAFFNVLCRPFFFECNSALELMAGLENLLILVLLALVVFNLELPKGKVVPVFYASVFFVVLLFVLIGWVTPVAGAIVRYKVPALPFLGFVIVLLLEKKVVFSEKWRRKILIG